MRSKVGNTVYAKYRKNEEGELENLLSNRILCLNIFGAYKNTLVKLYKQNEMKPETGSRVDKQALQVYEYSLTTQDIKQALQQRLIIGKVISFSLNEEFTGTRSST